MNSAPFVSLACASDNCTKPSDLAAVHAIITGATLVAPTAAVRAAPDREARDLAKSALPGFIAAGLFTKRRSDSWQLASGQLVCDFDHCADLPGLLASLAADPSVALLFTSPSGTGCKAVLRVPVSATDPVQHAQAFAAAERWASEAHGAALDPSGKDPARLCYMAHDPAAVLRLDAVALDLDRWAPKPAPVRVPAHAREVPTGDAALRAAAYLDRLPPSIAGQQGHAALFRAACALVHGFDLPESVALDLLRSYNLRGDPETEAHVRHKIVQAGAHPHREPRGYLLNAEPARAPARAEPAPWPSLAPIRTAAEPPPFDLVAMIPRDLPVLADLVAMGSEALQVPPELIAGAAVGLAALAVSRAAEVDLCPGWREPAPLWVLPLLRPGERKSASLGMLTHPFHDWATAERKHMAEPLARYAERRRTMETRLGAVRTKAA